MNAQPRACIQRNPDKASIILAGRPINLCAIAKAQNMDPSYLSRVLNGKRRPRIDYYVKIAAALGMTLDEFTVALNDRIQSLEDKNRAIIRQYDDRIRREDESDLRALSSGRIPAPRLPALRSA